MTFGGYILPQEHVLWVPVVDCHVVMADKSSPTDVADMGGGPLEHGHVVFALLVSVPGLFRGKHPTAFALSAPEKE